MMTTLFKVRVRYHALNRERILRNTVYVKTVDNDNLLHALFEDTGRPAKDMALVTVEVLESVESRPESNGWIKWDATEDSGSGPDLPAITEVYVILRNWIDEDQEPNDSLTRRPRRIYDWSWHEQNGTTIEWYKVAEGEARE